MKPLATTAWPGARSRNENRGKVLLPPWRLVYLSQLPVGDRKGEPGRLCREHWGARADGPGVRDSMTRSRSYGSSPAPCTSQAQHERQVLVPAQQQLGAGLQGRPRHIPSHSSGMNGRPPDGAACGHLGQSQGGLLCQQAF